jgi:hypothetical protein
MHTPETMSEAGREIVARGTALGISLRLVGGLAVWVRSIPETRAALGREYGDLDFVSDRATPKSITALMEGLHYSGETRFNAVHGERRLLFNASDGSLKIDIFRERFEMCHTLDLRERLTLDPLALTAADLALTKLQVVDITRKDLADLYMLILDHPLHHGDAPDVLNIDRVTDLCATDWGWYTTVMDSLETAMRLAPDIIDSGQRRGTVVERLEQLRGSLASAPKSRGWRLRAKLGRRIPWHESPEEVA